MAASIPRAVGWLDNGDGTVTAAFAAPGDTNIDWQVDVVDALNFVTLGKFDTGLYDAGNYNTPPGASGIAAVPEPSAATLTALAVAGWAAIGYRNQARRACRHDR